MLLQLVLLHLWFVVRYALHTCVPKKLYHVRATATRACIEVSGFASISYFKKLFQILRLVLCVELFNALTHEENNVERPAVLLAKVLFSIFPLTPHLY